MPWTIKDVPEHNKAANTAKLKQEWVAVANSALKSCMDDGGSEESCAASAIQQANGVIKKAKEAKLVPETSMQEMIQSLSSFMGQFHRAMSVLRNGGEDYDYGPYIQDVLVMHPELGNVVITRVGSTYWAVPYTTDEAEGITLAPADEWTQVLPTYTAVSTPMEAAESAATMDNEQLGHAVTLLEAGDVASGGDHPLILEVVPISPGWGNKRDNFFYSRETLAEAAPRVFADVKMFESDHGSVDNSQWVSTVLGLVRIDEDGAPVVKVGIHDPAFARRVLNLASPAIDKLHLLECSIMADGTARNGYERDGRKGRYVEHISSVERLDWVTRAGARGHAVRVEESAAPAANEGGKPLEENEKPTTDEELEEAEPVQMHEEDTPPADSEPEQETPPEPQPDPAAPPILSEARTREILRETNLPTRSAFALLEAKYEDEDALQAAITQEVKRLKDAGSGKPFAQASQPSPDSPSVPKFTEEEYMARFNRIQQNVGLKEVSYDHA